MNNLRQLKLTPHTSYLIPLYFLLAACQPTATPTAFVASEPAVEPKQLATVYMSPTPNAAEQEATRLASRPTPTVAPPTPLPSATPYIGVFLGEAEAASEEGLPIVNPALFDEEQPGFALPTAVAASCPVQSDPIFGENWSADPAVAQAMACPIEAATQFNGTVQLFERGVMYWRGDTGEIWAIAPGTSGRFWYAPNAPPAEETPISPPEGLRVPTMGFGNVWRGVSGVREALGFARTDEQPASFTIQRFQGGTLLIDGSSGQVFALVGGGTAYGPY
jgi:hypothetical protein